MSKKEILIQAILGSLFMALMMSCVISLSKVGLNLQWLAYLGADKSSENQ
ncbi:DUF2798 domain-containing protein [Vibrio mimicus]|nr:DUF2798 domain-containing protein [Vibrio mimicus]TXZ06404.1 DUF2798 domain-containing protein [Vibrio mimicus]